MLFQIALHLTSFQKVIFVIAVCQCLKDDIIIFCIKPW